MVEPKEPLLHPHDFWVVYHARSIFQRRIESGPHKLGDGRVHPSLCLEGAEGKAGVCVGAWLHQPLKQGHVQRVLMSTGIRALQLVVVDLRPQLQVVSNQNGMFDRRKQGRQNMSLKNLARLFAHHDLASKLPQHGQVSGEACCCRPNNVCFV